MDDQEHTAKVIQHNLVLNNALRFAARDYLASTGMMHIGEIHIQKQKKAWIKQVKDALA